MEKCCVNSDLKIPEFERLLNEFKLELSKMSENSSVIYDKVNMIKNIRCPKNECLKEDRQEGIIFELWSCINKMREHNDLLSESGHALIEFVG